MIKFTIPGKPKALKRHRSTRKGRMYDPSAKDKHQMWLQIAKYKPKHPLAGDIMLKAIFYMPRPKSHYRTGRYSHLLKSNAPKLHTSKPDIDNIAKFYLDALTGSFWRDDAIVCALEATKVYAEEGLVEIEYWNSPE